MESSEGGKSSSNYIKMRGQVDESSASAPNLSMDEIYKIRELLASSDLQLLAAASTADSEYPEFRESTHAWAVFADNPKRRAGPLERLVGCIIIIFQLFAYNLFAQEAIKDFQSGQVPVTVRHDACIDAGEEPQEDFQCTAKFTDIFDALVAYIMLGIFLAGDFLQAGRAIRDAPGGLPLLFACLAGVEVSCAFLAASVAVSYNLFIGEVTDAVEVGVGLLFIRELSQQTYNGMRNGNTKQYRNFLIVLAGLVLTGLIMDPLCAKIFAGYVQ